MFMTELDAHGNSQRASNDYERTSISVRRVSTDSTPSTTSGEDYLTAANSLQRISSGGTSSGLGISGIANANDGGRTASSNRVRMGSSSTITAAAEAQRHRDGGILRQTDVRRVVEESRDLAGLDAALRRRSMQRLPRDGRWAPGADREALSELAHFLRNVTPPPGNYMSLPSPTSLSSMSSSIRRRNSGMKKKKRGGPLGVALGLFRRGSKRKKPTHKKRSGAGSPPTRSPSVKKRKARPPRIRLPDTAVAGTTVEGHRHIAISIPVEHAHLGPEGYAFGADRRLSTSSNSSPLTPKIVYKDVNVRPMSAFAAEPLHVGTQLAPLFEERESLSSRSWEKSSSSHGGVVGQEEAAAVARKVRLASRNTFGTVHEYQELSRPGTSAAMLPASPTGPVLRISDESSSGDPRTPRTSEERRASTRALALAALAGREGAESGGPAYTGTGSAARPSSAYSFRSFTTPSPSSRVYFPTRKSSLHPGAAVETRGRGARSRSNSDGAGRGGSWPGQQPHSRDSSRDQTLQESIFSERSFLESLDTVGTGAGEPSEGVIVEAKPARRFEGRDVVVCQTPPRKSGDSKRTSDSSGLSAAGEKGKQRVSVDSSKRMSGSSALSAGEKFMQRMSADGKKTSGTPSAAASEKRRSGQSAISAIVDSWEKRGSGGSIASAVSKGRAQAPAPIVETTAVEKSASKTVADESKIIEAPPTPKSGRRSRFVENLTPPGSQGKDQEKEIVEAEEKLEEVLENTPSRTLNQDPDVPSELKKSLGSEEESRPRTPVQQTETETKATKLEEADEKAQPSVTSTTPVQQPGTEVPKVEADGAQSQPSDPMLQHQPTEKAWLTVPEIRLPTTPQRRRSRSNKGKQKERSPTRATPEDSEKSPTSPIPSPKERRAKRQSTLLSRKMRLAEFRKALDQPGFQPSDLVLERRLSISSNSSGESTPRDSRKEAKRNTFPYPPNITALAPAPTRPRSIPTALSFTRVVTVADVRPSSPTLELDLARKGSITLSISSPATTILKASPIPPFRSLGSVTPPESPADGPPADDLPLSPFQFSPIESPPLRHKHSGSIKRTRSRGSRHGRPTPSPRSPGLRERASPSRPRTAGKGVLPSKKEFFRPATAQPSLSTEESKDSAAAVAGPSATMSTSVLKMSRSQIFDRYEALREKQTHDMEKRIKRLERNGEYWLTSMVPLLSELSLTMGRLAEGRMAERPKSIEGKGKGKETKRETTTTTTPRRQHHGDGRHSRFGMRAENVESYRGTSKGTHLRGGANDSDSSSGDTLDRDEAIVLHPRWPYNRSKYNNGGRSEQLQRRLYLQDSPLLYPDLGYRVENRSFTDDESGRPISLNPAGSPNSPRRPHYRRSRTMTPLAFVPTSHQLHQRQQQQRQEQQQQHSGSTTMVDSATAPRANSFAATSSQRRYQAPVKPQPQPASPAYLREDVARLEKLNERVSAGIRNLSSYDHEAASPPKSFAKRDREGQRGGRRGIGGVLFSDDSSSLRTYDDTDRSEAGTGEREDDRGYYSARSGSGMDTVEPLMRELQVSGSRVSLESLRSGDIGDDEVRKMKKGLGLARAVVGFGAFSM